MISLSTFQSFAFPKPGERFNISRPFFLDGYYYSTDGRIAIRSKENSPSPISDFVVDIIPPKMDFLPWSELENITLLKPWPVIPEFTPIPVGPGYKFTSYNITNVFPHRHTIDQVPLDLYYLDKVHRELKPDAYRIIHFDFNKENPGLGFTFDNGGQGVLMPLAE